MKKTMKILLLAFSLLLILGGSVLSVLAEGEPASDAAPAPESTLDFPVKETYYDAEGNLIHVLEDGTKYNSGTQQWILEEKEGLALETDFDRMLSSLQYMWKGMLSIFVVIGVIILSVYVLNGIFGKLEAKKKEQEAEK